MVHLLTARAFNGCPREAGEGPVSRASAPRHLHRPLAAGWGAGITLL
jgi:hypothetical protein